MLKVIVQYKAKIAYIKWRDITHQIHCLQHMLL